MLHNGWICWHSPPCSTCYSFLQLWSTQQFIAVDIRHCVPYFGFPRWVSGKESACQCRRRRRHGFDPWVGKVPWRRKWQPTPLFLPGKSHGQRNLVDYSPWSFKRVRHGLATKQQTIFYCLPVLCNLTNTVVWDTFPWWSDWSSEWSANLPKGMQLEQQWNLNFVPFYSKTGCLPVVVTVLNSTVLTANEYMLNCLAVAHSLWPHGSHEAPLSMEFSWQEYWSRLPFCPPGRLPDPGIEPLSPLSCIAGRFFVMEPPGNCKANSLSEEEKSSWIEESADASCYQLERCVRLIWYLSLPPSQVKRDIISKGKDLEMRLILLRKSWQTARAWKEDLSWMQLKRKPDKIWFFPVIFRSDIIIRFVCKMSILMMIWTWRNLGDRKKRSVQAMCWIVYDDKEGVSFWFLTACFEIKWGVYIGLSWWLRW